MALPTTRPRSRVLTASAANLGEPKSDTARRRKEPWQNQALEYINLIPELNYASRFYSRMMKQLRIYPGFLDDTDTVQPTDDELAVRVLKRIHDPGGGMSQILGNYGRLMFATGEGMLFGRELDTPEEKWAFLWNDELDIEYLGSEPNRTIKKVTWKPNGDTSGQRVYDADQVAVYRMWVSSPGRSGEADSPMRAALQVAQELLDLTDAVSATATSRTTQGVWLLPMELAPPPAEGGSDEDPLNDPFMEDLIEHLTAQKKNAGTAEAAAPFLFWGAYEYLDRARKLELHDRQNDYAELGLRKEAVERLARGFDFPPEVLLGLASSNHWAARQILDDMWRSHGAPIAEQFCDDLNEAYFRPALKAEGYARWPEIVIGYDESQIVVKPDRSEDADKALDRIAIGYEGYRKMKNIPDAYKPTPEEEEFILSWRVRKPEFQPGSGAEQPKPDAAQGPPAPGPEGDSGRRTRVTASAVRELGAMEMAVMRCRELAGSRIRQKAQNTSCADCVAAADGKPLVLVAAAVGFQNLKRMKVEPRSLVTGGTDALRPLLLSWGYTQAQTEQLCEVIEVYAARTLFDEKAALPAAAEAQIQLIRHMAEEAA